MTRKVVRLHGPFAAAIVVSPRPVYAIVYTLGILTIGTMKNPKKTKKQTSEKPASLAPLDFDEAIEGLLAVKPEKKAAKPKPKKQLRKKKGG